MDGKIWGYGAGETRPIPSISFLFRRFPENQNYLETQPRQIRLCFYDNLLENM